MEISMRERALAKRNGAVKKRMIPKMAKGLDARLMAYCHELDMADVDETEVLSSTNLIRNIPKASQMTLRKKISQVYVRVLIATFDP